MDALRFGLMGCGRISPKHADAIRSTPGAILTAVCDVRPEAARAAAERFGVPAHASVDQMLDRHPDIDVVNILTPSGLHAEHAVHVAGRGHHVVVEKPMALRLADADRMILACDQARKRLFVVKQNRYNPPIQRVRRALEEGRFGKLVLGAVRVRWTRRQDYYDQAPWRGTWSLDGGVLANQASHHIDALEWMMGDVESVFAMKATRLVRIEAEDTAIATLRFANGALGVVEATTACRPRDLEGSLSILGEGGSAEIGGFALNELVTWQFEVPRPGDDTAIPETRTAPGSVYGFGHGAVIAHVVDCIRNGRPALVDGIEGRRSLELISAIYESSETGREVALRYAPRHSRLGRE